MKIESKTNPERDFFVAFIIIFCYLFQYIINFYKILYKKYLIIFLFCDTIRLSNRKGII